MNFSFAQRKAFGQTFTRRYIYINPKLDVSKVKRKEN